MNYERTQAIAAALTLVATGIEPTPSTLFIGGGLMLAFTIFTVIKEARA